MVPEGMLNYKIHRKFLELFHVNIGCFVCLRSLSLFIGPAYDRSALTRVADILHKDGPPQPISVRFKCVAEMLNHKVCYLKSDSLYTPPLKMTKFLTRDWDHYVKDIFKFSNVTELQVITAYDTDEEEGKSVQQMIKKWATKCRGEMARIEIWTGAEEWVETHDFCPLPLAGQARSGSTFVCERTNSVWC